MKLFLLMVLSLVTVPAFAAIDTTAVVTALGDIPTAIAAVGAALVTAAAVAVGWKWLKGAIFG